MKNKILILFALALFISLTFASAVSLTDFNHRETITITGGETTLTNFTVFLKVPYNAFMQTNFNDLYFTSGNCNLDSTTALDYELDSEVDSTNASLWVKIPTLTTGSNSICMYFGNSTVSNLNNSIKAWDDNYVSVYHFSDLTGKDSRNNFSSIATTGTPTNADSLFGKGVVFDGSTHFDLGTSSATTPYPITVEILDTDVTQDNSFGGAYARFNNNVNRDFIISLQASAGTGYLETSSTGSFETGFVTASPISATFGYNTITIDSSLGTWFENKLIVDSGAMASSFHSGTNTYIGYQARDNAHLVGTLDELRVSNVVRDSSWINRSYDNIDFNLFSLGTPEVYPLSSENIETTFVSPTSSGILLNNQTIIANLSVVSNNITSVQIRLYNSAHSLIANSSGVSTFVYFNGLTVGTYYLNASATNVFGNSNNTATSQINVTGNLVINFVSPTSNGTLSGERSIITNVTISPSINSDIHIFLFNSNHQLLTDLHAGGSLSNSFHDWIDDELDLGTYYLNATITNDMGLINYTETRIIIVNSALLMQFDSPTSDGVVNSDRIKVNLTSTSLNLTNVIVRLYNSTGLVISANSSNNKFYVEFTGLDNGVYFLNATGLNGFGTTNKTDTKTINFTYLVVTPPQSLESSSLYTIIASTGAGLGKLIIYISIPLAILILVILVVVIISFVLGGLGNALKHLHIGGKK